MQVIVVLFVEERRQRKDGKYEDVLMELPTMATVDMDLLKEFEVVPAEIVGDKFFNSEDAGFTLYDRTAMAHAVIRRSFVRSLKVLTEESVEWDGYLKRVQLDLIL